MQFSGESAQAGVPVQHVAHNPGMVLPAGGQYVAGVWQTTAQTLELNNDGAAHPKTQHTATIVGVDSTLQQAHQL